MKIFVLPILAMVFSGLSMWLAFRNARKQGNEAKKESIKTYKSYLKKVYTENEILRQIIARQAIDYYGDADRAEATANMLKRTEVPEELLNQTEQA